MTGKVLSKRRAHEIPKKFHCQKRERSDNTEESVNQHFLKFRSFQNVPKTTEIPRKEILDVHDSSEELSPCTCSSLTSNRRLSFSVNYFEMEYFFELLGDKHIERFLLKDKCRTLADKYLLAMVFTYFKRAEFNKEQYTRKNFFAALYLAHDMEEEEDDYKYDIVNWASKRRTRIPVIKNSTVMQERDALWRKIDHRAVVSRKCCEEIMAIEPDHKIWQRERPDHHSGAVRYYLKELQSASQQCGCVDQKCICQLESTDSSFKVSTSICPSTGKTRKKHIFHSCKGMEE